MKRFVSLLVLSAFGVMLSAALAYAQDAVDVNGTVRANFLTSDDVYVEGTCVLGESQMVDIYVMPDQPAWPGVEDLIGLNVANITGQQLDAQGNLARTLIWSNPLTVGDYDVVFDIDRNGTHEGWETCIDDVAPIGFTVTAPPTVGIGSVVRGANDPGDHGWIFGPGDPNNVMLQISLTADNTEEINVSSFDIGLSGSGDDGKSIDEVKVYEDVNSDGILDQTDTLWGSAQIANDDGVVSVQVNEILAAGSTTSVLVVYLMGDEFTDGDTFQATVNAINATGVISAQSISIANLPISSGEKTVTVPDSGPPPPPPPPSCTSNVQLNLDPSTTEPGTLVNAVMTGFSNCEGKTAELREISCLGSVMCSCVVSNAECSCGLNAPGLDGNYNYFACFDANGDQDFDDTGEQHKSTLKVETAFAGDVAPLFTDIEGHWAEEFIDELREKGIVQGKEEGMYEPDALVTRAELTKIALLAFGFSIPEKAPEDPFPDVLETEWYAKYIWAALGLEVLEGYADGTFKPNQVINRVETLKILLVSSGKFEEVLLIAVFPDTDAAAWYAKYLNFGIANGILSGYKGGELAGMFGPANFTTRAEVAKMVSKLLAL